MGNNNNYIEYINENALPPLRDAFVDECEKRYNNKLRMCAEKINEAGGHEIVLLAGPSSSGKTTTAQLIANEMKTYGKNVFTISLDDYYKNTKDAVLDENGNPDFETVYALDLGLLTENLKELITVGETNKPLFDFLTGCRKTQTQKIKIGDGDVVVVEGLHALNPLITNQLPNESVMKIYVNLNSRIYNREGKIILNKRNIRFVRRMIRDFKFRNSTVENTFMLWEKVTQGEEKYLYPFKESADIKINSLYLYEPCVFRDEAVELLEGLDCGSNYYSYARTLIAALKRFESIPGVLVPPSSLLREFLGY